MNNRANVFALAGYAFGKVDILAETTATSVNENSFAWGAGADVAILPGRFTGVITFVILLPGQRLG